MEGEINNKRGRPKKEDESELRNINKLIRFTKLEGELFDQVRDKMGFKSDSDFGRWVIMKMISGINKK